MHATADQTHCLVVWHFNCVLPYCQSAVLKTLGRKGGSCIWGKAPSVPNDE